LFEDKSIELSLIALTPVNKNKHMKKNSCTKYFRVFKNETSVTEVSTNDFKPNISRQLKSLLAGGEPGGRLNPNIPNHAYFFPPDKEMFYGYTTKIEAMERAKTGAIAYINFMIKEAELCIQKLKQYRIDHYEDLNINFLDEEICSLETGLNS
jgi:hypothetical protein